jgi:hypothetical protein
MSQLEQDKLPDCTMIMIVLWWDYFYRSYRKCRQMITLGICFYVISMQFITSSLIGVGNLQRLTDFECGCMKIFICKGNTWHRK